MNAITCNALLSNKNAHMICSLFLHIYILPVLAALASVAEIRVQALVVERLLRSVAQIKALVAHLRSVLEEGEKLFKVLRRIIYVLHTLNLTFLNFLSQMPRFGGASTSFGGANKGSGFGGGG